MANLTIQENMEKMIEACEACGRAYMEDQYRGEDNTRENYWKREEEKNEMIKIMEASIIEIIREKRESQKTLSEVRNLVSLKNPKK